LAAYYKTGPWKAQLNVKNVFDREYLLTQALAFERLAAVRVGTATPRSLTVSLAREF
jgi:outer membrane receptor protein involved in Fe transport